MPPRGECRPKEGEVGGKVGGGRNQQPATMFVQQDSIQNKQSKLGPQVPQMISFHQALQTAAQREKLATCVVSQQDSGDKTVP